MVTFAAVHLFYTPWKTGDLVTLHFTRIFVSFDPAIAHHVHSLSLFTSRLNACEFYALFFNPDQPARECIMYTEVII